MSVYENAIAAIDKIKDRAVAKQLREAIHGDDWLKMVEGFHTLYKSPNALKDGVRDNASHMTDDRIDFRISFIEEELDELKEARETRNVVKMADALGDIIYVTIGMAIEMGINIKEVMREVQASNMTKLDANGDVIFREDGKVLKGPNFCEPDLASILNWYVSPERNEK